MLTYTKNTASYEKVIDMEIIVVQGRSRDDSSDYAAETNGNQVSSLAAVHVRHAKIRLTTCATTM